MQSESFSDSIAIEIVNYTCDTLGSNDSSRKKIEVINELKNLSNSNIYFWDPSCVLGYQTFSLEIQIQDSIYEIFCADKLWWRSLPTLISLLPGEAEIIQLSVQDSSFSKTNYWVGLPNSYGENARLRAVYNSPVNKFNGALQSLRTRDYRKDYRDMFDHQVEYDSIQFVTPDQNLNSEDSLEVFPFILKSPWMSIKCDASP